MKIEIKLIDSTLPLPTYQTSGSVAFDLYARRNIKIPPWKPTIIPANVIIEVPKGFFLLLASRSSTPIKRNLIVANGIGVIDQDYHGDKDEFEVVDSIKKESRGGFGSTGSK